MRFDLPAITKTSDHLDQLTVPFTTNEIDTVIKDMPSDHAPGPDGFNGTFLKACWVLSKMIYIAYAMNFMMEP